MAKSVTTRKGPARSLFIEAQRERHPRLFIRRMLVQEAERAPWEENSPEARAWETLKHWADLADQGHLGQKESSLDAEFLEKIFGRALNYQTITENPENYHREKQFPVPGAGTADGALGKFVSGDALKPLAIIELKGANTDLDHDKSSGGRTPVQQLWDYLNQLPDCPWGILSNYVTIRLYHRDAPQRAYEEFLVQEFRDKSRFCQFYYLFQREGLLGNLLKPSRALELFKRTKARQKEVGPVLYEDYSRQRLELIAHLVSDHEKSQNDSIHIAQKILDRIIFVAFCEDRHLLPEDSIKLAYTQLPRFYKVTNPRWQNFKALFGWLDEGNSEQGIPGYNGGLFATDPHVDDLELDDKWTHFFNSLGKYDFRDEVNVDVLGHLFEQSVTELEKLRIVGLFGKQPGTDGEPTMLKSAQRKRFGIYYTPPDFTRLIVESTLGEMIRERVDPLEDYAAKVAELRRIKVCDPACGSGAFLIAAFDALEATYFEILRLATAEGDEEAEALLPEVPDWILKDNLYGVDLSSEAVEITQLALWLRSARKGRKLSDLSQNIVCGNSLVRDPAIDPRAIDWQATFPMVFDAQGGFDVVIGNPPWERMKLQEREFFSLAAPDIASAVSAADRRKKIATVEAANPELWARYETAQQSAARNLDYVRQSGEYPFTGRGDVNTYMVFAELARKIVAPSGRVGLLVPSGIATDDTTKHFFNDLIENQALVAIYDFENKDAVFPDVHRSFKFCVLLMNGAARKTPEADFVFFARRVAELDDKHRHIPLSAKDLKLFNPNTQTCPIFRSRQDAQLTKAIYRRVPILIDKNRREGGNPWGIKFRTMFHQTNDAELFVEEKELKEKGYQLEGNRFRKRKSLYLPLYEGKMIEQYDHRFGDMYTEKSAWYGQGRTDGLSLVDHQNPERLAQARFWVEETAVRNFFDGVLPPAIIAFRDITNPTNRRTMLACFVPPVACTNKVILACPVQSHSLRIQCCLLANYNALVFDYVVRQKMGGISLNFFIVEQLPTLPPGAYAEKCPWSPRQKLEKWISDRVLKLTCTAEDMIPLAEAAGFNARIHRWNEQDRARLRAELDAAYFILYGIERDDVEYILSTFQGIRDEGEALGDEVPTRQTILDCYDRFKSGG